MNRRKFLSTAAGTLLLISSEGVKTMANRPVFKLRRMYRTAHCTVGVLLYCDHPRRMSHPDFLCFTLEPPWANNEPYISCIESGTYQTRWTWWKERHVPILLDVPGRSDILIHTGNFIHETQGCILIGMQLSRSGDRLLNSSAAMERLKGKCGHGMLGFDLHITQGY